MSLAADGEDGKGLQLEKLRLNFSSCFWQWAVASQLHGEVDDPAPTSLPLPCRSALVGQRLRSKPNENHEWSPVGGWQMHSTALRQLLQWTWLQLYWIFLSLGFSQRHREGDTDVWAAQYLHTHPPRPSAQLERRLQRRRKTPAQLRDEAVYRS